MRRAVVPILAALVAGCGHVPVQDEHVAMFGYRGEPIRASANTRWRNIILPQRRMTAPGEHESALDAMIEAIRARAPRDARGRYKVLLFVHGGLNTQYETLERVRLGTDRIMEAGYFPVFVNWQSSFARAYAEHLFVLRQGEEWRSSGWVLSPFYLAADLARAAVRLPLQVLVQLKNAGTAIVYTPEHGRIRELSGRLTAPPDPINGAMGTDHRGLPRKVWPSLLHLVTLPFKMATAPVIDAFGTSSWIAMHHAARSLFQPDADLSGRAGNHHGTDACRETDGAGGFAALARRLEEEIAKEPERWAVTIVGHSMGTIVMNEMIRRFGKIRYDRIVYMAAACTVRDYEDTIFPYLDAQRAQGVALTAVHHLTLHPKAELGEMNLFDLTPRGSLLVWLDDFLTTPANRSDRTAGRWANLVGALYHTPCEFRGSVAARAFAVAGPAACRQPEKHTHFGQFPFWDERFWTGSDELVQWRGCRCGCPRTCD